MLSPQLRPFRKFILAAGGIKLLPQGEEFALEFLLLFESGGGWGWEAVVEVPCLWTIY
jgi:hypothetical protein